MVGREVGADRPARRPQTRLDSPRTILASNPLQQLHNVEDVVRILALNPHYEG